MFINPAKILQDGIVTYPSTVNIADHLQQNGIDIDCDEIWDINSKEAIIVGKASNVKLTPKKVEPSDLSFYSKKYTNGEVGWVLEKGKTYTFESSFGINIPSNMCGWVVGRSTLNRQGVLIRSSWYDSGFKSPTIGATIYCFNTIIIEKNARIAQVLLAEGESASMYNGQYQS